MKKEKRRQGAETRKKRSLSLKKYYSNPEVRKESSREQKKYWKEHPELRKKMKELTRKYYSNLGARKKLSEIKKKQYKENPKLLQKMDKTMTKWWHEHPNIRKERSDAVKRFFINNPQKFSKFLKYGKNSSILHIKTKQGFIVRSRGEQKIANFLAENRIKSAYESKTLIFEKEGQICVPDFWLPKFKMYIEFYGGHPKAWKKKVMKNKLYKKHKIPCIFITPAELRDLEYYLKRELG